MSDRLDEQREFRMRVGGHGGDGTQYGRIYAASVGDDEEEDAARGLTAAPSPVRPPSRSDQ